MVCTVFPRPINHCLCTIFFLCPRKSLPRYSFCTLLHIIKTEVDYYAIQDLSDIEVDNLTENVPSIDDLPIPFLDDSLDIEPNMGTLEVWDASTPLTMSPSVRENSTVQEQESATNGDSNASL